MQNAMRLANPAAAPIPSARQMPAWPTTWPGSRAAPSLAASYIALKRDWERKYVASQKNGKRPSAISDMRPMNSGNFCADELEGDLNVIADEAWQHDGKLSIAIRKLRRAGKLSQTLIDRFTVDARRDKGYVAKSVRQEIKARLQGLLAYRQSKWKVNMTGPRIQRDHSGYAPGDFFTADDVTLNIPWWFIDDRGQPAVTRGECLMFLDCRSLYPLGYILVPGHYNGETIRRGILHIHDRHGLPHRGFVFEQGVWKSRLVAGEYRTGFLGWDEYEMGLRERRLSVEMLNVATPGAKLIEGVFNISQQAQRNERGFVGFHERE
jgi:hypothetical protein